MRTIKPLTNKQIEIAKPKDKPYRLYDGAGLSLCVSSKKTWHFSYAKPYIKKRTMMSLGTYPQISLVDARALRDEYNALLAKNIDPQEHKRMLAQNEVNVLQNTFARVGEKWLSQQNYSRITQQSAERYLRYANAYLAQIPVAKITSHDILTICETVAEKHSSLIASCVKTKIAQVLDFALGRRLIDTNVARQLTNTHQAHQKGNRPALTDSQQFSQFLRFIHQDSLPGLSFINQQFLKLAPYLFVRPGELAQMHCDDIDWQLNQWRFTPSKTKKSTGVQLIVPLSRQAIKIIKETISYHGQDYVFCSVRRKEGYIENRTISAWVRANGFQDLQTLHGLRASAKTILEEVLEFDPRYVEMQLGHVVKDANGTAYNRTKFIKRRTEMMQAWADYLDELIAKQKAKA
ncbi:hypothetical protein B0181_04955 [Moraxella caviae]|uniref:Prophage CP4-57 integrase n=1 Tax=Moraxella caviae TaxID=34060 RepID=A0A1T0A3C6_9GAMM|nr:integrase arm-type DNA-binding domain-containing protein [Moraxella caviae]OOR90224.1 hypothetical protein B0181_04955 [Moraxella caviae]STZ14556.1 Prophage CP4-57 integrase [Moraxella caviae]VEW12561.1 Prophage CP4-57 integrase [Moraxella caviae]